MVSLDLATFARTQYFFTQLVNRHGIQATVIVGGDDKEIAKTKPVLDTLLTL